MARPTKLTPALRRAVCTMLQNGVPEKTAALAAGIAESTHHDWMAKGRDAKSGIHRDYFEAVETAKAKAEAKAVRALTKSRDWRAQLAFLERGEGHARPLRAVLLHAQAPDGAGRFRLDDFWLDALEDYFVRKTFETLLELPTGNGKSTLFGALALHHATYVRVDPRVIVLGGQGKHGNNTLDAAAWFISQSVDLSRWWEPQKYGHGPIKSLIPEDSDEDVGIFVMSTGGNGRKRPAAASRATSGRCCSSRSSTATRTTAPRSAR
jgi:hypothetical protein